MCQHNRKANRCAECVAHLGPDAPSPARPCFGLNDGVSPVCAPNVYEDLTDPGPVLSPEEKRDKKFQESLLRESRRKLWTSVFIKFVAGDSLYCGSAACRADEALVLFDARVKKGVL